MLFPLVLPGIIATSVFAFIAAWNDYLVAYTFMKDQAMLHAAGLAGVLHHTEHAAPTSAG